VSEPSSALRQRDAQLQIDRFLHQLRLGEPWFEALLDAIAAWDIPHETVDGREYRYLYGGEAFDWLLLAERLCDAGLAAGLLPEPEVDALLLDEDLPERTSEDDFRERLGAAKYRAHLNFIYGVRLEEALHLTMEERIHKERGGGLLAHDRHADPMNDVFQRIYGADRDTLLREFRSAHQRPQVDRVSLTELKEFTYWLFKRRVAVQDPARVASDTRLAMLTLQRLQEAKRRRLNRESSAETFEFIDAVAVPSR
jgi:hypothetical protein